LDIVVGCYSRMFAQLLGGTLVSPASGAPAYAAPSVATAPGRVVVDVGGNAVYASGIPLGALQFSVAEADGSMLVLVAPRPSATTYRVVRIGLDGALDRSFGEGGVKTVEIPGVPAYGRHQIVRQRDGKLLVVGSVTESFGSGRARVTRLNDDLSIDLSYGIGGSMTTGPLTPVGAAVQRDGSLVLSGSTDGVPASTPQTLNLRWSLTRVTSAGAIDTSFGANGIVTIATQVPTDGESVDIGPDGTIVAVGHEIAAGARGAVLTRLTANGVPDTSFAAGVPVKVPLGYTRATVARSDGSVLLEGPPLGVKAGDGIEPQALVRYTATGSLDLSYGKGGVAYFGDDVSPSTVLPLADGGAIVSGPAVHPGRGWDVPPAGPSRDPPPLGAGQGDAATQSHARIRRRRPSSYLRQSRGRPSLLQNTFRGGTLVPRPDGSFLVPGAVGLSQPNGKGEEVAVSRFAAAVLTPSLRLDRSFGGAAERPRISVNLAEQDASDAVRQGAISVSLKSSAIGLARLRIAHRGRDIARNLLAVLTTKRHALPVALTPYGKRYLRSHPRAKLSIEVSTRDLLANVGRAHARGRLR